MKTHWKDYYDVQVKWVALLLSVLQERKQQSCFGSFCQRLFLQFASCCTIRSMNYSNSSSASSELDDTLSIERTLVLSLLSFLTSFAVIGNIFILICIISNAALQRPGHLFIASLALADLILALTVMIPRLSDEILGGWHFGHFLCQVSKCSSNSIMNISIHEVDVPVFTMCRWGWLSLTFLLVKRRPPMGLMCQSFCAPNESSQFIFGLLKKI